MKKVSILAAVWLLLAVLVWFAPQKESSDAERRLLAQRPEVTAQSLLDGSFMEDFEAYSLDQFPWRDAFRGLKAVVHNYGLWQKDNNQIYIAQGTAAQMEYPLDNDNLERALSQFQKIYDLYLGERDCQVVTTVVPDKGYYLAKDSGHLSMDYPALFSKVKKDMDWATYVDITDCLSLSDYYRTDTHWRQERLLPTAQKLCEALGVTMPVSRDFTETLLERPFYGVYYGQAALPMKSDTMHLMDSDLLDDCRVYYHTDDVYGQVYDMEKAEGKDMYETYLSGAQSLLRIENPNATTDRELVIFRDSFGSSLAPLLVQDYKTVTLVDLRYIAPEQLGNYLQFDSQDVLFMYSSLVLNIGGL